MSARSDWSASVTLPLATSTQKILRFLSLKASFFESGAHWGGKRKMLPSLVTCRSWPEPSAGRTQISYSPLRSERYATQRPSGDQVPAPSRTPEELVRLRISPFSAGTEKISPRAVSRARLPVGEMDADSASSATFLK